MSSAGDFNGDGIGDVIIGAPLAAGSTAQGNAASTGQTFIIFGQASSFTDIDLTVTTLSASNAGFQVCKASIFFCKLLKWYLYIHL